MRILLSAILLFSSATLCAQSLGGASDGVEPRRSVVIPCSSAEEANGDKSTALRYAIEVGEWQQTQTPEGVRFSSGFDSPFSWIGRLAMLSVESATAPYTIYVDGREVGSNYAPSLPAHFNVTRYLKQEAYSSVEIVLHPDAATSQLEAWGGGESPSLGRVVMLSQPTMYVRDVEVETERSENMFYSTVAIVVKSEALNARTSRLRYELVAPNGVVAARGNSDVRLSMRGEDTLRMTAIVPDSMTWSPENPNLYRLNVSTQYRGRFVEYQSFMVGVREVEAAADGEFVLNGKPYELRALSVGAEATEYQLSMAKSAGYNTIKFEAGALSPQLCDYADSIGLFVVATAPINTSHSGRDILRGGNPTNDPGRLSEYIERVDAMYNTTKLHPSVIAFSLADSSLNGYNLYESYLYLKRRELQRPIIYAGSEGEWNSDPLKIEF